MLPVNRTRRPAVMLALTVVAFPLVGAVLAGPAPAAPAVPGAAAGTATPGLVATASAPTQSGRGCAGFPDQAAAQAALDTGSGDPALLDADGDGRACEDHPYPATASATPTAPAPAGQVPLVPVGAVPAGDGSAAALLDGQAAMHASLDREGGAAFVGGLAMVALLVVAGVATVVLSGRMLLAGLRGHIGDGRTPGTPHAEPPTEVVRARRSAHAGERP